MIPTVGVEKGKIQIGMKFSSESPHYFTGVRDSDWPLRARFKVNRGKIIGHINNSGSADKTSMLDSVPNV